ncbi:serine dehydratase beta chain [Saccharopolyspora griseoalba]|uniref:L-serine ammonia-lyase n=1 Tax=Saccharopolyspora griseoalba TaxID=1431848 RepID=A0ABW2LPM6_9PSEU
MSISAFDLFSARIGPSSSHTTGPMVAARRFAAELDEAGLLGEVLAVRVELFGSLGTTGRRHGSDRAVLLGLLGEHPRTVDPDEAAREVRRVRERNRIALLGEHEIDFDPDADVVLHRDRSLPAHPNGLLLTARTERGSTERIFYSVGGGFVVADGEFPDEDDDVLPHPFATAEELIDRCRRTGTSISDVVLANEAARRPEPEVRRGLLDVWAAMRDCVRRGCERDGELRERCACRAAPPVSGNARAGRTASAVRARSVRPALWPRRGWPSCSAERPSRSRTPPRSGWSTTSA